MMELVWLLFGDVAVVEIGSLIELASESPGSKYVLDAAIF